jgi:hypothetical protein
MTTPNQKTKKTMKNKSYLITGACIAALAFCAPLTSFAADKKSASASPSASPTASAAKSERPLPYHGMISAVDQSAKTFTIASKESTRVFKITDKTLITKAGSPATMADVVEKEEVRGSYWKNADGTCEAKTVKLGPKTASAESKKSKSSSAAASASPSPSASAKP